MRRISPHLTAVVVSLLLFGMTQVAARPSATPALQVVPTAFTYQGRLMSGSKPADGTYAMTFRLYDAAMGGAQVGADVSRTVTVTDGHFTTQLDFGAGAFTGSARWLAIEVGGTLLTPRQALTAAPYALYSSAAPWGGLQGIPAGFADGVDHDTTYTAGVGLTLNGTQFGTDTSYLQRRVSANRTAGSSIRAITADGTVTCEVDDNTTYSSGLGLSLNGTVFSADTAYLQRRISSFCSPGGSIRRIGADGGVTCELHETSPTTYTAGPGLALTGTEFRAKGSPYANILVVAKSGGDFSSVQAALNSITDASTTNPYLVYVAPGIYTEQVTLESYVTLEGAGQGTTVLQWTGGQESNQQNATLVGANDAVVRHLTIESIGTGKTYAVAVSNDGVSPMIDHVTVISGDAQYNTGVADISSSPKMTNLTISAWRGHTSWGVSNVNSSPAMTNVTVTVDRSLYSYGIFHRSASPAMTDVTVSVQGHAGSYGIYFGGDRHILSTPTMQDVAVMSSTTMGDNYGIHIQDTSPTMINVTVLADNNIHSTAIYIVSSRSTTIRDSRISGAGFGIRIIQSGNVKVANSELSGILSPGIKCHSNYDANLAPVTCP